MKNRSIFIIGITGVSLFVISSIVGGLLINNYSVVSQFISESYAIDTEYGLAIRTIGYIPSGVFIIIFCLYAAQYFQLSKLAETGYYGLAIFYGLATVIVGFFPCDSGCNRAMIDPSISQIIHNLAGLLTYLFVPISIMLIGFGLRKIPNCKKLSMQAFACGALSLIMVFVFTADPESAYLGIYQRIIETIFAIWIITSAIAIKNNIPTSGTDV